ncbi:unnamed protein product [Lasius platythorax]|uniref:Queuosine 5'-phosphate N-glycosylase/hydrolase n=1 Tax=Lasius platythorax TaxID=488582 RepID=A0AAV2P2K4_9HYME
MAKGNSSGFHLMESLVAAKFITEKAQDVHINQEGIKELASHVMTFLMDNIEDFYILTYTFLRPKAYPVEEDSKKADWLFVLHTLNFSLWNPKGTKQWTVNGSEGYCALCFAIKRAIDEKTPIWDPKYYTRMTQSEFEHIFRSDDGETSIPLIHERLRILREVGKVLLKKYRGTFVECIKSSGSDADKLVKLLFNEFGSYRDEAIYGGFKVRFHSKARSLVSDIWIECSKEQPKFKLDTKEMISTMFIDYRILLVLLHFKVLLYSDVLVNRFENSNEPLEHGCREEIEIRGCSLFAANKVCKEVQKIIMHYIEEYPILNTKAFNIPILVDNYLFKFISKEIEEEYMKQEPFHYVRTVHY